MEIKATAKHVRIAPRKVRLIAGLIRGLSVQEAEAELFLSPKRPAVHVLKLLRSAIANAKEAKQDIEKLFIKEIRVDGGPSLKRWRPRARGSAGKILKRTSHISIVLGEGTRHPKRTFVIIKKQKETKETKEIREKRPESPRVKPKEKAEKEKEKKGLDAKPGKRKMFQRKSV